MGESPKQRDKWVQICLFCGMGALTWAIRGTSGWGGFDGAVLPGMIWALLLYTFINEKKHIKGWACFLYGLGISIGGMWGYGVYVPWLQSKFILNSTQSLEISPLVAYWGFFLTGFAWGAPAAVLFCWKIWKTNIKGWIIRLGVPLIFCALLYSLKHFTPDFVYPFYSTGIYETECLSCTRSMETNSVNYLVFFWLIGALIAELLLKNMNSFKLIALVGISFGVSFAIAAMWCLFYGISSYTDWWKMWELSMGFAGGLFTYIFMKQYEKIPMTSIQEDMQEEKQLLGRDLSLFTFFGVSLYGFTSRLGNVLELYSPDFNQYDVPPERLVLILLLLIPFVILFFIKTRKESFELSLNFWMHTACFVGFVGITTIWPSNLVILYFLLFWFSLLPLIKKNGSLF